MRWLLILLACTGVSASEWKISHAPKQPRSGDTVKITATTPSGKEAASVAIELQVVEPGSYIRKSDRAFSTTWQGLPLKETNGAYVGMVPSDLQKHRRLVRYRLKTVTTNNRTNYFPALTNSSPNLAYFVYDGPAAWTGASKPDETPLLTFSPEFFNTLPAYHLIANALDVRRSQWDQSYYRRPLFGTFVYDGEVYDHMQFHNRGQASTYVAGKNKWGFKFMPDHEFSAKNAWGEPYSNKWNGINLNPCASAWAPVNRGMAGMDEAVAYRVYQLAGVPSPDTFWVQFRVIDSKEEAASQYEGDLWGLYLVVQEKNGSWLKENNLPDGNIYSAESGPKHIAAGDRQNGADLIRFRNDCESRPGAAWWRAHLDLSSYYSFHALNRLVANIDLRPDGNYYLYHRPDDKWVVLPHDLDMMFIPKTHQPGFVPQSSCLEEPALRLEYRNRAREILDLLASDASPNGGQIGQLVAEFAQRIAPPGQQRTWAELDQAIWNWHPRSHAKGQFYLTPYRDHRMGGAWQRRLETPDFAGFCKYLVEFCTDSRGSKNFRPNDGIQRGYGFGYLALEANDAKIPARPTLQLTGWEARKPKFTLSEFSSPSGANFAALQLRVAQISAPGLKGYIPGKPYRYEIEPCWTTELQNPVGELTAPAEACPAESALRARVRYKDHTGRWSHWSEPVLYEAPGK